MTFCGKEEQRHECAPAFKKVGASDIKLTPTWQGQSTAGHIHNFLITLGESPNSFLNALLKLKELFKYETTNVDSLYPFVIQYFGKYYYRCHEYKEALKYFKEVFDMLVNNHEFPLASYFYIVKIYLLDKAYSEALFLSEKALKTAKQKSGFFSDKKSEALLLFGIGKIYDAMNEKEKADHYKTLAGNLYSPQALEDWWSYQE